MDQVKNPPVSQEDNMHKVRELLFGNEIKKQETEIEKLKENFGGKVNELRKHVDSQFESLKNMIAKQNESLTLMIQKIESSSDEKFITTNKKISEANDRNLKTFESISKTQNKEFAQLEKAFFDEIEKLATDTQRDISILRETKLSRNMLVKFLTEATDKLQVKK